MLALKTILASGKSLTLKKSSFFKNAKIVYCPPYTLLNLFVEKLKKTKIEVGAQNCHQFDKSGPCTGSINARMIKQLGCRYVIIGHSENRAEGETNSLINKKIKSALKNNLKVILCIGETLNEKKRNLTKKILSNQIRKCLEKIKNFNNLIIAYEPVWSIGTGIIPKNDDLKNNIIYIKKFLKKKLKLNKSKILYGGSVNPKNINDLTNINEIDGFLVGGASQKANKFIDIIKKTFN